MWPQSPGQGAAAPFTQGSALAGYTPRSASSPCPRSPSSFLCSPVGTGICISWVTEPPAVTCSFECTCLLLSSGDHWSRADFCSGFLGFGTWAESRVKGQAESSSLSFSCGLLRKIQPRLTQAQEAEASLGSIAGPCLKNKEDKRNRKCIFSSEGVKQEKHF